MLNQGSVKRTYGQVHDSKEAIEAINVFTDRESQCMSQAMQRKTLAEISKSMGIGKQTVYFYLTAIRRKLKLLAQQAFL